MSVSTQGQVQAPYSYPAGMQSFFVAGPDLTIPLAEKKEKDFGLKFARGLEQIYLMQATGVYGGFGLGNTAQNYMYARGAQPFMASTAPIENFSQNDFQTLGGADMSNLQLIPAILDAVVGKLIKRRMRPQVSLLDAMARREKQDFRAKLEMLLEVKRIQGEIGTFLENFGMTEEDIPLDVNELEMKVALMPQFELEMNMELALRDVCEQSGMDVLDKQVLLDLLVSDKAVGWYINRKNGKRQIEKLPALQYIEGPSMYEDRRDVQWRARLRMISLEALRAEAAGDPEKGKIPDEELKKLKGGQFNILANGLFQWAPFNGTAGAIFNNSAIYTDQCLVIDFEFLSTDTFYINSKGEKVYSQYKEKKQGKDGNVVSTPIQHLFEGSYICGSNGLIYDYGIVEDAVRQPIVSGAQYINTLPPNPTEEQIAEVYQMAMEDAKLVNAQRVYSNFITYQSNMIEGISRSFVARAIPQMRALEETRKKFNKYIEEFLPWLTVIDQDSLAKIVIDDNGTEISAEDALATAITTGKIIGSSSNLRGLHTASFKDAFQIVANQGGQNLQMLWSLMLSQIALVREMLGVSSVDIGVAPQADQGKAVTQMQASGTDNVLNGIVFAREQLHKKLWETLMWDILNSGAVGVMGEKAYMIPEGNPDERILNLRVDVLPSAEEWTDFFQKANEALAAKTLTMENYAFLKTLETPKQAWAYLSIYTKRNEIKQSKAQAQIDQANTERQMASNAQAHQNKMDEILEQNKGKENQALIQGAIDILKIFAQPLAEGQKQSLDLQELLGKIATLPVTLQQNVGISTNAPGGASLQPAPGVVGEPGGLPIESLGQPV